MSKFKKEFTFNERISESSRIINKYSDRIPIICEKIDKSTISEIDKKKYLVPSDLTCAQFIFVIRKRLNLTPEKAIFLFINGIIPQASELISSLYNKYKDSDGFLYITYASENVFGS